MGGKNHQPCSGFLKNSTELSRCLSLALAHLELGNVAFEDVILVELDGGTGSLDSMITSLERSQTDLAGAKQALSNLKVQMDDQSFEDLPSLQTVDLDTVGERLASEGKINEQKWRQVAEVMREHGFYGMIDIFDQHLAFLSQLTGTLIDQTRLLKPAAAKSDVAVTLEENREGNLRPAFAALYTEWGNFNALFLASSLVSTELWYAWNRFGSLAPGLVSASRVA